MYDKIAKIMNDEYHCSDMDAGLVEQYLRRGNCSLVSDAEIQIMEQLLEKLI